MKRYILLGVLLFIVSGCSVSFEFEMFSNAETQEKAIQKEASGAHEQGPKAH